MVLRDAPLALQGRYHGGHQELRERLERLGRVGYSDPPAAEEDRFLGPDERLGGSLDVLVVYRKARAITPHLDALWEAYVLHLLLDIFGDIDQDRPGPPRRREVERLHYRLGYLRRAERLYAILRYGGEDADHVRLLERVPARHGLWNLAR